MLILTRKIGESITVDDHIKIQIIKVKGKQVRLGIDAPKETKVHREEVYQAIKSQNRISTQVDSQKSRAVSELLKKEMNRNKEI